MRAKTFLAIFATLFGFQAVRASPSEALSRIMPLGDSITRGVTGSSDQSGYRFRLYSLLTGVGGYQVDFVGSLADGNGFDFDTDHEGHAAFADEDVAQNVYDWLTANPADIVLLHIGSNALEESPVDVEDILNEIDRFENDNLATIWVLLARIINRNCITDTPPCPDSLTTTNFNSNVAAMAQDRIDLLGDKLIVVDMENGAGIDYHLSSDVPPGDMWDNLHPQDTGYEKLGNAWFSAVVHPLADAGPDQSVEEFDAVNLDGSGSEDLLGTIVLYNWVQTGGTPVNLSDPTAVQPSFTAPDVAPGGETLVFELTVENDGNFQSTATTTVQVDNPGSADNSGGSGGGGGGCFIATAAFGF